MTEVYVPNQGDLDRRYAADMAQVVVLRMAGVRASGTTATWRANRCWPFVVAVGLPYIAAGVHLVFFSTTAPKFRAYGMWLLYYTLVNLLVVLGQWVGCRGFHAMCDSLDRMLTPAGRVAVHAWIDRGISAKRQWRYVMLGAVGAVAAMFGVQRALGTTPHLFVDVASYMVIVVTGAAAANSNYWMIRAIRLARIVTNPRNVKLLWFAPSRTIGLERVARWYRFVTLVAAAGLCLAFVPIVYVSRIDPGNDLLITIKWVLAGTFMVAITLFGLYSQWRLSWIVEQARAVSIRRLEEALPPRAPRRASDISEADARVNDLLSYVIASPNTAVNGQTLASTLLAMFAGALPFIVTVLLR
ncbi:hypothetical protein [Streptomyces liangshanensis]|uniref:Gustatory receptor n=1 Tax=Streptomyces liangshanensis TaxID=2717324 RepID=A0A6G9H5Q7_9ACTN|nr:hypothetical protein [Streptomyces liangshanensis]QIQ05863.1 hypothetical protein HA039_29355 [Streptomyces liangshanensis]